MKNDSFKKELYRLSKAELLLIRIGQHLFCEWRDKGRSDKDLEASFEKVWELKREIRVSQGMVLAKMRHRPSATLPRQL